jgi:hypothetical protein
MLFILIHVLLFFFFVFFHNLVLPIQIVYVGLSEDLVCIFFMFLVHVPPMCLLKILLIKNICT